MILLYIKQTKPAFLFSIFFFEKKVNLSLSQTTLSNIFVISVGISSNQIVDVFGPTTYLPKELAQTLKVLKTYLNLTSLKFLFFDFEFL